MLAFKIDVTAGVLQSKLKSSIMAKDAHIYHMVNSSQAHGNGCPYILYGKECSKHMATAVHIYHAAKDAPSTWQRLLIYIYGKGCSKMRADGAG